MFAIKERVRVVKHERNSLDRDVHEVTLQIERDPVTYDERMREEEFPLGLVTLFVSGRPMVEALQLGNAFHLELTAISEQE